MEVLKQTSPTRVPVAPNDSPSKIRPSSRARIARMFAQCAASRRFFKFVIVLVLMLVLGLQRIDYDYEHEHEHEKTPNRFRDSGFLKYYPDSAVKVDIPFP